MIRNIVFDIGNVMVRWDPLYITQVTFQDYENINELKDKIFKNTIWFDLNLGKFSEKEAIERYKQELGISETKLQELMENIKTTQVLLPGSVELLINAHAKGYNLYALTDNVKEIISYLKKKYDFWQYFKGVVNSSEVGFLKPSKEIYYHLLASFHLIPEETIFLDDTEKNVIGAREVGIHALQFSDAKHCIEDLRKFGITLP